MAKSAELQIPKGVTLYCLFFSAVGYLDALGHGHGMRVREYETPAARKICFILEEKAAALGSDEIRRLPRLVIITSVFCAHDAQHLGLDFRVVFLALAIPSQQQRQDQKKGAYTPCRTAPEGAADWSYGRRLWYGHFMLSQYRVNSRQSLSNSAMILSVSDGFTSGIFSKNKSVVIR